MAHVLHLELPTAASAASVPAPPAGRPLRIVRLLALAQQIQDGLDHGTYRDEADAARALGLTRARVCQIMHLLRLSPRIQIQLLDARVERGCDWATEHGLRWIAAHRSWAAQELEWRPIARSAAAGPGS